MFGLPPLSSFYIALLCNIQPVAYWTSELRLCFVLGVVSHGLKHYSSHLWSPAGIASCSSPLLLFVNSLPSSITYCNPYLFADDVTLLYVHDNKNSLQWNQSRLESDLSACQLWASNVGGEFSPAKTTQIRNYSNDHPIQLSSQPITIVEAAKHLGVYLTPDQSNTIHLQTILKTFQRRVSLLCFMGRHPAPQPFYFYKGFVRPALEHATSAWSYAITKAELERLNILQAGVARKYLLRKKNCR